MLRRPARRNAALIWLIAVRPPRPDRGPWPTVPACRARPGPRTPPARPGSTPAAGAAAAAPCRVRVPDHRLGARATTLTPSASGRVTGGRAQLVGIGAHHVRQHVRVAVVALGAGQRVPFPVPEACSGFTGNTSTRPRSAPRPTGRGRSRSRSSPPRPRVLRHEPAISACNPAMPAAALGQPPLRQDLAGLVHHLDVVMILGPVGSPSLQRHRTSRQRCRSPSGSLREQPSSHLIKQCPPPKRRALTSQE